MDTDSGGGRRLIPRPVRASRVALALALLAAGPASADGPGPRPPRAMAGDWDESLARRGTELASPSAPPGRVSPPRRVTGGPDYVGSDYGLGKPAYFGLGSRPDWGRGSTD